LRNGPGNHKLTTETGEFACSHWFDGFSHLYRFELAATPAGNCEVNYSSRRQVDGLIEQVRKTGRLEGITFGQKVQFSVEIARKCSALTFVRFQKKAGPMRFALQEDEIHV
jgi:torulene dioxygenase